MGRPHARPAVAPDGKVWFVGQASAYIANLDPATGAQKQFSSRRARTLTLIVDEKGTVWRRQPERSHRAARSSDRRHKGDHDR